MSRLDLGISQRKAAMPVPAMSLNMVPRCCSSVDFSAEATPGDAKSKSWHDDCDGFVPNFVHFCRLLPTSLPCELPEHGGAGSILADYMRIPP
jgi:hypothetical protein